MNQTHKPPFTASVIPSKPPQKPRHRHRIIMAVAEYMALGTCLSMAGVIAAVLILQLLKLL